MSDAPTFSPADLEQHRAFLRRLAGELVRGDAAADDLVQETFVRALERPPAIAAALKSWLARVAQRLASNQRRAAARRTQREAAAARPESIAPHDDALASLELQQRLLAALKSLDEPYRTTLWLRWHEGLGPSAIAARTGLTVKGVEARLTRGIALLRAELDRRSGGERARWLGAVASLATGGPPAALATGLVGGVLAVKKLGIAAALLAVAGAAWWVTRSDERSAPPTSRTTAAAPFDAPPLPIDAPMAARTELPTAPLAAAPAPPLAAAFGSLRVRVRWADGRPAEAITLFACPEAAPNAPRVVLEQKSDAQGETRFAELFAGPVRLEADRGVEARTVVAAGAESTIELELVAGVAVEGRVVDEAGAPIAAAELLLISPRRDWLAARVVAHSDERGEFAVDELPIGHHLTARTPGRVPAFLQKIEAAPRDAPLTMEFVLDWRGIAVAGRVVDPDGRPVEGALVAAGRNDGMTYGSSDRIVQQRFGMPVTRSDADGRFELTGVEHAELCLAVMADGFPLHFEQLPHWVGVTSFCEVQLARPATLAVEVRTPEGVPASGATVEVTALHERPARRLPFPLPHATSGAGGVATLELVATGRVPLLVTPAAGAGLHAVVTTVDVAAGGAADGTEGRATGGAMRVVVTLARDAVIVGRAVGPDGRKLPGTHLLWRSQRDDRTRVAALDEEGRFRLEPADAPPYALELAVAESGKVLVERSDVSPGPDPIELRVVPRAALIGSFVVEHEGRASDAERRDREQRSGSEIDPRPAGKPDCFAFDRAFREGVNATWSGDNFTCGDLPPGTYRVTIRNDAALLYQSEWITLAAGETRDLGAIRSTQRRAEEPGRVALALEPATASKVDVCVRTADYDVASFVRGKAGRFAADSLPPGPCFLDVRADGFASQLLPLTIVSGETTELSATLQPGVARTLSFVGTWDELSVTVRDGAGRLVAAQRLTSLDPKGLLLLLPDGRYELSAVSERGARVEGSFSIVELAPQTAPLRFELR